MDPTASFCHRRSSSSDRFLGIFSFSPPSASVGEELNEAEVFWSTTTDDDFFVTPKGTHSNNNKSGQQQQEVVYRKPSLPILSLKPSTPNQTAASDVSGGGAQHHSAPMKVPVLSKTMMMERRRNKGDLDYVDEDDDDGKMLPPHELVARRSGASARTTFSVLEGVGRTLKGRDLRQVRNAIWDQTGFLD